MQEQEIFNTNAELKVFLCRFVVY